MPRFTVRFDQLLQKGVGLLQQGIPTHAIRAARFLISTDCLWFLVWDIAREESVPTVSETSAIASMGTRNETLFRLWKFGLKKESLPSASLAQDIRLTIRAKPLTRPLCPFPQVARYRGSGDHLRAESFSCAVPEQ